MGLFVGSMDPSGAHACCPSKADPPQLAIRGAHREATQDDAIVAEGGCGARFIIVVVWASRANNFAGFETETQGPNQVAPVVHNTMDV